MLAMFCDAEVGRSLEGVGVMERLSACQDRSFTPTLRSATRHDYGTPDITSKRCERGLENHLKQVPVSSATHKPRMLWATSSAEFASGLPWYSAESPILSREFPTSLKKSPIFLNRAPENIAISLTMQPGGTKRLLQCWTMYNTSLIACQTSYASVSIDVLAEVSRSCGMLRWRGETDVRGHRKMTCAVRLLRVGTGTSARCVAMRA